MSRDQLPHPPASRALPPGEVRQRAALVQWRRDTRSRRGGASESDSASPPRASSTVAARGRREFLDERGVPRCGRRWAPRPEKSEGRRFRHKVEFEPRAHRAIRAGGAQAQSHAVLSAVTARQDLPWPVIGRPAPPSSGPNKRCGAALRRVQSFFPDNAVEYFVLLDTTPKLCAAHRHISRRILDKDQNDACAIRRRARCWKPTTYHRRSVSCIYGMARSRPIRR